MKWIDLTQNQRTCVDDDVFLRVAHFSWSARWDKNTFYAMRNSFQKDGPRRIILLHRDILGLVDTAVQANHIDGNGLNNLRENLEAVSNIQNTRAYQTKQKGVSSGFRGVCWHRATRKWQSYVGINYGHKYLGVFNTEEEAARVRDQAALQFFGPGCQLNFPV
jgi:AP2 domain